MKILRYYDDGDTKILDTKSMLRSARLQNLVASSTIDVNLNGRNINK